MTIILKLILSFNLTKKEKDKDYCGGYGYRCDNGSQ